MELQYTEVPASAGEVVSHASRISIVGTLAMLFVFLAIIVLVYFSLKSRRRVPLALLFGGGMFVCIVLASNLFLKMKPRAEVTKQSLPAVDMSTEQMWEHLNQPRIPLDTQGQDDKPADTFLVTNSETSGSVEEETTDEESPAPADSNVAGSNVEDARTEDRPGWIDHPPKRIGNVYRVVVSSDRYKTVPECHSAIERQLVSIVRQRVEQLVPQNYSVDLAALGLDLDFVLREICREEWVESVEASFGEMKRVHVLMEFDAGVDQQLRSAYQRYERQHRIVQVGSIVGAGLGGLALLFGLLKVDTWTRGYYTKRLFLGVPAAIITVLFLLLVA